MYNILSVCAHWNMSWNRQMLLCVPKAFKAVQLTCCMLCAYVINPHWPDPHPSPRWQVQGWTSFTVIHFLSCWFTDVCVCDIHCASWSCTSWWLVHCWTTWKRFWFLALWKQGLTVLGCGDSTCVKTGGLVWTGDSYGPSPVSGGAPSPPLMIEGPGRPLSAPIGRRIDPYGESPGPLDSIGATDQPNFRMLGLTTL